MKVIVLAAGHGGRDPGAIGNDLVEKELNLTTTLAARNFLNRYYSGHKVVLTRDSDVYVSHTAQRNIATRENADIFVEIHYNSFRDPGGNGFETFILSSNNIFDSTIRNQRKIHNACMDYLEPLGMRDRGMKRSRHWHLVNTPTSVVLVEGGFLSSPHDSAIIRPKEVQEGIGKAIGQGIANALSLPTKTSEPAKPDQGPNVWYRVIAESYRQRANAENMVRRLKTQGIEAFIDIYRE